MAIRPLNADNAVAAASLLREALGGMSELPEAARRDWSARWSAEALLRFAAQPGALVCIGGDDGNDSAVQAVLIASAPEAGVVTVIWVLVSAQCRSHGLGAALMDAAARHAREVGAHKLRLTVPGARAKKFYERLGMIEEGFFRKHWYGADFWQMSKQL